MGGKAGRRGLSCGRSYRVAAEEVGPGSLGFENQGLLPRGPWELGTPGQLCVWKDGSGGWAEDGEEGKEGGTLGG